MKTSLRTQIILPKKLREQIERARRLSGESMAGYLRQAAEDRLVRERIRKAELAKLARQFVGSVQHSSWEGIDVVKWQRSMRKDDR